MKKYLLFFTILAGITFGSVASASLWSYYAEKGQNLPTVSDRIVIADEYGILNYKGLKSQNLALESFLRNKFIEELCDGEPCKDLLGASIPKRPTEFKTYLGEQKTEAHSGTTLKVTSVQTKDGYYLDGSVLGSLIVLSVNPGASNAETVVCSTLTSSTKTFSGCVFGYRFDNPTATTSANIKAHSPGEPVVISNTDTYLSQTYLTNNGDTTITASNTVSGLWTYTHTKGLCFSTSNFCIYSDGTNLKWTQDGKVNSYNFTSSTFTVLTASSTKGITITDSKILINASSTAALGFDSAGKLYIITSSSRHLGSSNGGILSDGNGLYIDESSAFAPEWDAQHIFNGGAVFGETVTISKGVGETSDMLNVTGTSTLATTTITDLSVGGKNIDPLVDLIGSGIGTTSTGQFLVATNSIPMWQNVILATTSTISTTSAKIVLSADTDENTQATAYTLLKDIGMDIGGKVLVSFDFCEDQNQTDSAYARVYVDGNAVGSARTINAASCVFVNYAETISVSQGSHIQLYAYHPQGGAGGQSRVRNLKVAYDYTVRIPSGIVYNE